MYQIPDDYQWNQYFTLLRDAKSYAIEADDDGNVYVASTAKNSSTIARILQKYGPDGTPIDGPDGSGTPWFVAYETSYTDIPWHKIAIDNTNKKIYILFATELGDYYRFWLASHEMNTGMKSPTWGGTKYVGTSRVLRGGLSIDSSGNVWTVLEEEKVFTNSGLHVKMWSGATGDDIVLANSEIYSIDKHKHYIAFGIRKTDNKMYLAYREVPKDVRQPAIDLVVTLWDRDLQFLNRKETTLEIPASDDPTEMHHPSFQDGFVDADGNFAIGGYYSYDREIEGHEEFGTERIFYPVVFKFNSDLDKIFQYVSERAVGLRIDPMSSFVNKVEGRVKRGPGNLTTLYYLVPSFLYADIMLIDNNGQLVDSEDLSAPLKGPGRMEYLPESGCSYYSNPQINDFVFYPEKIIETGPMKLNYIKKDPPSNCRDKYSGFVVISYYHRPRITEPDIWHFEWERKEAIARWIKENVMDFTVSRRRLPWIDWEPEPEPLPCPECLRSFSADWRPERTPSYITDIYRSSIAFISNFERLEHPKRSAEHIAEQLEKTPVGLRFTQSMQKSAIEDLKEFTGSEREFTSLSGKLHEAANAVDLDWRVPFIPTRNVKSGKNFTVDFQGYAWINFKDVKKSGECSLSLEGGLPALAEGFEPGWPIASYNFNFNGKLAEDMDIKFCIQGMRFPEQSFSPRVFEWNGNSYKDITTDVDLRRKVITGTTNRLSTYVIMNHIPESKEPRPSFVIANCAEELSLFDQECKDNEGIGYPVIDEQVLYEGKPTFKAIDICGIQAHAGYYMIGSGGKEFEFDINKYPLLYLTMKAEKGADTCLLLLVYDKKPKDHIRRFVVIGKTHSANSIYGLAKDYFKIEDDNEWSDYSYDLHKLREDYPDAETVRIVQFYSGKLCKGIPHSFHFSSMIFKK
jgi:hypothetical protein